MNVKRKRATLDEYKCRTKHIIYVKYIDVHIHVFMLRSSV